MHELPKNKHNRWTRVLFIDPGLMATGLAMWKTLEAGQKKATPPDQTECLRPSTQDRQTWEAKCTNILSQLAGTICAWQVKYIVIEMPEVWGSSAMSMASATSGDLLKLVYLVGGMGRVGRIHCDKPPVLITVNQWKGQLDKDTINRRIALALGPNVKFGNHISDAVGMGLNAQGLL